MTISNITRGKIGLIEYQDIGLNTSSLHFSEWWNGEGLDLTFTRPDKEMYISLHLDELEALTTAAILTNMIDIDVCKNMAADIARSSKERKKSLSEPKRSAENWDII